MTFTWTKSLKSTIVCTWHDKACQALYLDLLKQKFKLAEVKLSLIFHWNIVLNQTQKYLKVIKVFIN